MKNYIILISIFVSFITFAYSGLFEFDLLGGTELNGSGCVCHTTERDYSVSVWIEGPDTLMKGQTGLYKMFLANGPAEAGGYNVAGRFGIMSLVDSLSYWHFASPNELTQAFPLVFPTPQDTIYWEFAYTAPDSVLVDTIYSCGLSLVYDNIPDFHDRWNFGNKFPIEIIENVVPVELSAFTCTVNNNDVMLSWATATETNNMGFEIERKSDSQIQKSEEWEKIGFVNGSGTSTETRTYLFEDKELQVGNYHYRLKQIDYDGTIEYSQIVDAEISVPIEFSLEQNYPNPFNPSTTIKYTIQNFISIKGRNLNVVLKVYDVLGNEVATLVNEEKLAGNYEIKFDAKDLSSGIYFYELNTNNFALVKKMILMK